MCCQVWSLQRRRARVQASLTVLWCCLRIGPTTGRLAQIPDLHSLLRTVWPDIPMFARPGVLRAVSSAVIIRFRRWIRRKCRSWRCYVTHCLPLLDRSFVLPVCRRRIISLEMVILDIKVVCNGLVNYSSLNHTHRSLTVILTEPWHRRSGENSYFQNGKLFNFSDSTISVNIFY